MYSSRLL